MPRSRSPVANRKLVGLLLGTVVVLTLASAWQLGQSQSESRAALRHRFADRAPVATAVVDGFFRTIFTGQAKAFETPAFSGPRVSRAVLDALARRNKNTYALVTDSKGRVLGASSDAPVRGAGLRTVERAALKVGYGISDVRTGQLPVVVSAIRFFSPLGTRLLVSAAPEQAYSEFLMATLEPVVSSSESSAFVVDGSGRAVVGVGQGSAIAALRSGESPQPTGELGSGDERLFYATAAIQGSSWHTILTTPTESLYAPGGGLGRWLPWVVLALLVATVLAGLALLRRLVDTGGRLVAANAELESSNANLARSNADLEQFAYVASHDLSSPLRSVTGFSQMLSTRYRGQLDGEADRWIGFIEQGVTRMQRIIDDLLHYSRVNQGELQVETVDLDAVLDEVELSLAPMIEEKGAVITREPLPHVLGEPTHLSQVLQNLIANATIYVAPGVVPSIHIASEARQGKCRITVTDNGVGVDPAQAERIFKMFQRLHSEREHPGSGIGLAIAKKIVERHGGQIEVEAAPGGGTTFAFEVPLAGKVTALRTLVAH